MVRRRWSLAGQLLALQLAIVTLVLVAVAAVSLAQSRARFDEAAGRQASAAAETVAATALVRAPLELPTAPSAEDGDSAPRGTALLRTVAESARSVSGSTSVVVADRAGTVLASADPSELGTRLSLPGGVLSTGRSWIGTVRQAGASSVVGQVPVLSDDEGRVGDVVGLVAVFRERPTLLESLGQAAPNLLVYLGVASAVGLLGSLLVARRVKRQTLGLEPLEIVGLVEHRDALLHGIKEGVVALDAAGTVTLVNDVACELLGITGDPVGQPVSRLGLEPAVLGALAQELPGTDVPIAAGGRVVVFNRMPITSRGRRIGTVATLRDRTELLRLQQDLDRVHDVSQTLRAQAHEFANRLHTISGLIQLGEYDEVVGYVDHISQRDASLTETVTERIADRAVAALLIAKASLATEQGVDLVIADHSRMPSAEPALSADVATVLGNLVDNALDAAAAGSTAADRWVRVELVDDGEEVTVAVSDSGPGVAEGVADRLFERGVSTKQQDVPGGRGIGLSLVHLLCTRRGGGVEVRQEDATTFVARLPHAPVSVP